MCVIVGYRIINFELGTQRTKIIGTVTTLSL